MDTTSLSQPGDETWAEQFSASLQSHRDSVNEFLAAQRERFERAETILEEQIELLERKLKGVELQQSGQDRLSSSSQGSDQGGHHDWEAEKRRVFAMLDGGLDGDEATQNAQRLTIENVLQTTDQAIAEKDREIEELKRRQLETPIQEDGSNDGEPVEQAETDKILDSDAVIQEERKRLLEMQNQLQEKLRQAEIELSMERAQLARLRADLETKARAAEDAAPIQPNDPNAAGNSDQPAGSRWLARLGLTNADRERIKRRK